MKIEKLYLISFCLILLNISFILAEDFKFTSKIDSIQVNNFSLILMSPQKTGWLINTPLSLTNQNESYVLNILEFYNNAFFERYLFGEMKESDFDLMKNYSDYTIYFNTQDAYWISENKLIILSTSQKNISENIIYSLLKEFPSDLDVNILKDKYDSFKKPNVNLAKPLMFSAAAQTCVANDQQCSMSDDPGDNSYWTYQCCSGYCHDVDWSFTNVCKPNPLTSCRSSGSSCVINGGGLGDDTFQSPECCSDWCMDDELSNYCGLTEGQWDCDKGVTDFNGYKCIPGLVCSPGVSGNTNDHCCRQGYEWDGNSCVVETKILSAYWSTSQSNTGDTVSLNAQTSGFNNGQQIQFDVYENDNIFGYCGGNYITTLYSTLNNNFASTSWVVANGDDQLGNVEYCFKATAGNKNTYSSEMKTLFGHNGWDCDFNDQCATGLGLICDGSTSFFDFNNEGCCYNDENWNDNLKFCNRAITGQVFNVIGRNGNFVSNPYSNIKIMFNIYDHFIINPFHLTDYNFSVIISADSNGKFSFNPEHSVSMWNSNILFDYGVYAYAIEGQEIIGGWSNDFSNEDDYVYGKRSVNQIVRIHTDKPYWKKTYSTQGEVQPSSENSAPQIPKALTKSFSVNSASSYDTPNDKQIISARWNGTIKIENGGVYTFSTPISGGVKLTINNEKFIDSWEDNLNNTMREGKIILDSGIYPLLIEYYHYANSGDPMLYWKFGNGKSEPIPKSNLIRSSLEFQEYNKEEIKPLMSSPLSVSPDMQSESLGASASSMITNNLQDYQISVLEDPSVYNKNLRPVLLVHGLHGGSGSWDYDLTDKLNQNGLEVWKFNYPNDQPVTESVTLLGDAIDYILSQYPSYDKIDVVAHSMGGLVTRAYIGNLSQVKYKGNIRKTIFLSSPFYGSYQSNRLLNNEKPSLFCEISLWMVYNLGIISSNPFDIDISEPAYQDLIVGSPLSVSLNNVSMDSKNTLSIGGNGGIFCAPFESSNSDSLVSLSSASLMSLGVPLIVLNADHSSIKGSDLDLIGTPSNRSKLSKIISEYLITGNVNSIKSYLDSSKSEFYFDPNNLNSIPSRYNLGEVMLILKGNETPINSVSLDNFYFSYSGKGNIWYHFNYDESKVDKGLEIPAGNYNLYVNSLPENYVINVKPAQTNIYTRILCNPSWSCTNWGGCVNNAQSRVCTDLNSCNKNSNKPAESQFCIMCVQNWQCSSWGGCFNSQQTRSCSDLSNCNNLTGKPAESQSCINSCTPSWSCTNWGGCVNNAQSRVCTDLNSCNNNSNKPAESQSCTSSCIQNWQCSSWTSCLNNQQTRVCNDLTNCNNLTGKPVELQSCSCVENWQCSSWSSCSGSQQTRSCTDINNCGTLVNKPTEINSCSSSSGGSSHHHSSSSSSSKSSAVVLNPMPESTQPTAVASSSVGTVSLNGPSGNLGITGAVTGSNSSNQSKGIIIVGAFFIILVLVSLIVVLMVRLRR